MECHFCHITFTVIYYCNTLPVDSPPAGRCGGLAGVDGWDFYVRIVTEGKKKKVYEWLFYSLKYNLSSADGSITTSTAQPAKKHTTQVDVPTLKFFASEFSNK